MPAILKLTADRPRIMGIVNVTPDSFSDGGRFDPAGAAIAHAIALIKGGADILDIGGESTRPGATPVDLQQELDRVMPVIEALTEQYPDIPLSVDTQKPAVMQEAISAGVAMVNDVNALRATGAVEVCVNADVKVCLMHMQGQPRTMQDLPHYDDVVAEVKEFLLDRVAVCITAGIAMERIIIDPGIGFGKSLAHNILLLRATAEFVGTGYATMIGASRKSMFTSLLDCDANSRLVPSVVAAVYVAQQGAAILRVHDVRETSNALRLMNLLTGG